MRSESVELDEAIVIDPVELGARTGLLWTRHGLLLAGIGEAARIRLNRPGGADEAQAALAAITGPNDVGWAATGPVAFAALPFNRETQGELIVPQVVIGVDPKGRRWITTVDMSADEGVEMATAVLAETSEAKQATSYQLTSAVTPEKWRDDVRGCHMRHGYAPER